jgi:hypothetical protein
MSDRFTSKADARWWVWGALRDQGLARYPGTFGMIRLWLSALVAVAVCGVVAPATAADESPAPLVVVLSWDGVRHDGPDRGEFPGLARMARDGVHAGRLIPVYPSSTFPAHVSIATGTYPDRHGIIDNQFIDRSRPPGADRYSYSADADWIEAEPLWIAAERQGVPSATYFWVGSETDWRGQGSRHREAPFDGDRPEADKVDRILAWLALPDDARPRLIMSYWAGTDSVGHDRGPEHRAVTVQLQRQDVQLQRLLDGIDSLGLWPRTTLLVVSDHGMTETGEFLDVAGALADADVPARVTGSAVAQIYLEDPGQAATARQALAALEPARVYDRSEIPAAWRLAHPNRSGDLTVTVAPPYVLSWPSGLAGTLRSLVQVLGGSFGGHGYDPHHPDMAGIFLAMGRGVHTDLVLPEVQQIDLAATVARLLGIDPPRQSEGRPIPGIGQPLMTRHPSPLSEHRE